MHEVETMAYFGQLPWHGLGTALEEADLYDWPSASAKAGLNWEAELVPLVTAEACSETMTVRRSSTWLARRSRAASVRRDPGDHKEPGLDGAASAERAAASDM